MTGSTGATGSLQASPLDVLLATGSPTSSADIGLTITSCTGYQSILVNEGSQPAADDPAWQPCVTTPGAIAYELTPGGGYHSLQVWGLDTLGSVTQQPAAVGVVLGPQMFALGNAFSCMLVAGAVECWGDNTYGELGLGTSSATPSPTPTVVPGLESNVDQLAGGIYTQGACALQGGEVYCWGLDDVDELGTPATGTCAGKPCSTSPQLVMLGGEPLTGVTSIFGGASNMCATVQDQSVVCWGDEEFGQDGNGVVSGDTLPVAVTLPQPAVVAGAGADLTCFILGGTQLACAGIDYLTSSNTGQAYLGVDVSGIVDCANGYYCVATPVTPEAITQTALPDALALGLSMVCMQFGGSVDCWGSNPYGQLGNDTLTESATEVSVLLPGPADLAIAGAHHACARLASGEVLCWGLNDGGQLGFQTSMTCTGGAACATYPQIVPGLGRVAGMQAGRYQTCAALDSSVACWGGDLSDMLLGQGQNTCAAGPCSYTPITIPFASSIPG